MASQKSLPPPIDSQLGAVVTTRRGVAILLMIGMEVNAIVAMSAHLDLFSGISDLASVMCTAFGLSKS